MIQGLKYWNDREHFYVQTNNGIENLLKSSGHSDWLESCGPSAMVNIHAAAGKITPTKLGGFTFQPEDLATICFNDSRNFNEFSKARPNLTPGSIPGNRVPQYYPYVAQLLYGTKAAYAEGLRWQSVVNELLQGAGVQLCLQKPGHYIAVVAYDLGKQELIYNDSWPNRFSDNNGYHRRMDKSEFTSNVKPFRITYFFEKEGNDGKESASHNSDISILATSGTSSPNSRSNIR